LNLVGTKDDRESEPLLRIGQVFTHVTALQDVPTEEPQGADLRDHRPDRQMALLEQEQVVASELGGCDPIEARTRMLAKHVNNLDVAADGGCGVVATHHLVAQALQ
jgi:hypothetical protein